MILVKQLYKDKLKSKSFILMTLFYVGIIAAVLFWSDIKALFSDDSFDQIAVVNETDISLQASFVDTDKLKWVEQSGGAGLEEQLEDGDYLAIVTLTEDSNKLAATITSVESLKLNMQTQIQNAILNSGQFFAMGKVNLTEEQTKILLDTTPIITENTLNEQVDDGKTSDQKAAGMMVAYVSGFLIYIFVITYLSMITTDIASEKGSRALEMLLVSVRPETHFKAKIAGVIALALTQFGFMILALFALVKFTKGGELWDSFVDVINELSLIYILYIVAFLFATLILFLIVGALFGSLVSKVEEAGQVMTPAIMVTLIGFYVMISGLSNPDTLLIKVFSYIPFTSGMVMPMRIGATDLAAYEPLLSLAILVVSIVAMYFVTLSMYKRSVLTYASGGIIQKIKSVFKFTT